MEQKFFADKQSCRYSDRDFSRVHTRLLRRTASIPERDFPNYQMLSLTPLLKT